MTIPDDLDQKELLARLAPFNQLPEPELERLAATLRIGHFQPSEILLDVGEIPACLYIVV
mgnify:CR=1 FL=1